MNEAAEELEILVKEYKAKFSALSSSDWDYQSALGKWTKKQILGHLIDSAANNHQRFVRVQFEDTPAIVYNPDNWNKAQNYNSSDINVLIGLFRSYNLHLAHIINNFPTEKLNEQIDLGKEETYSIEWIMKDYLRHLQHHLGQIVN